jgi:cysteine desulfurase
MKKAIYLDYNASTPVDPFVLDSMLPYFSIHFGNANSPHSHGWVAESAVETARKELAEFIHAEPDEIIFTSGATESINLAIKGVFEAYKSKGKHIIVAKSEHHAVLDCCLSLEKKGAEITYISVNREGLIDLDELKNSLRNDTLLVCTMLANNETGVIENIEAVADLTHQKNALLMSDATQAVGKIRVDLTELLVDLMPISAHKIYGPKGVGALFIKRKNPRVTVAPQQYGGGHEKNLRSGTLNVAGIVGLGTACKMAAEMLWEEAARLSKLRTQLEQSLLDLGAVYVNGSQKQRLPNVSNLCFKDKKSSEIMSGIPLVSVSSGSACSSKEGKPSHVLKAMGISDLDAFSSLRFSLGRYTTQEEINTTIEKFKIFLSKN